jgi:DNA-binding response OmpR family regulator
MKIQPRVLLVDDDVDVREYTAGVLEDAGYVVAAAARAEEAERLLSKGDVFDLVITDIVLPGQNGIALAQSVRRLSPGARILFTTGYTRHIAGDGIDGMEVLDKPYLPDALLHAVRHVLRA